VRAGDTLVEIRSTEAGRARAGVAMAAARRTLARQAVARVRSLVTERIAPERELQQAEADLSAAEAEVEGADTMLRALGVSAGTPPGGRRLEFHAELADLRRHPRPRGDPGTDGRSVEHIVSWLRISAGSGSCCRRSSGMRCASWLVPRCRLSCQRCRDEPYGPRDLDWADGQFRVAYVARPDRTAKYGWRLAAWHDSQRAGASDEHDRPGADGAGGSASTPGRRLGRLRAA